MQLTTSLTMTTQLHQAIQVLQLSVSQLPDYLRQANSKNPLLLLHTSITTNCNQVAEQGNWFNDICEQVELSKWDSNNKNIALALIYELNEYGFFDDYPTAQTRVQRSVGATAHAINAVTELLQHLGGSGFAARDSQELLLLQLQAMEIDNDTLAQIGELIRDHVALIATNDVAQIADFFAVDVAQAADWLRKLRRCRPMPKTDAHSVQPRIVDAVVDARLMIEYPMLDTTLVDVDVDELSRLRAQCSSKEERKQLQKYFAQAAILQSSLQERKKTLQAVVQQIVLRQSDFFSKGARAMSPLTLRDIADGLSVHISTISRTVSNKYLSCPQGIFALKYFFSSHVGNSRTSSSAIKAIITDMICTESSLAPLSDNQLSTMLAQRGISIARRTIAKYRQSLSIPALRQRQNQRHTYGSYE